MRPATDVPPGARGFSSEGSPQARGRPFCRPARLLPQALPAGRLQLRSLRAARMLPVEFVDELPELMPELLPEFIELPELVLPVDEPLVDDPVPVVLPELVLDGLVLCAGDGVLGVPVVVVALSEGEGVVLLDGVVVVDELELDCAIAAPPAMSKDAAASAVVVFKNEPMVMTPDVVKTKCHRLPRQR